MRICFLAGEVFRWGKFGGFGQITRTIGSNLVKRGIEVSVVTGREQGQKRIEELDGMTVLAAGAPSSLEKLLYYRLVGADIYQSEQLYASSYLAMKAAPKKKHMIVFQDPRDENDYRKLAKVDPSIRVGKSANHLRAKITVAVGDWFAHKALKNADAIFCQAKYVIPKVMGMYGLEKVPAFLPNPVEIPKRKMRKADWPTVCFLGRWDPVKNIEAFFDLASKFKEIKFIAMGIAHNRKRDNYLRAKYSKLPNLEMPSLVVGRKKSEILEKSWILVNTSFYECLPVSFLEACAHKCAILSCNNPDNFAENFGLHVTNGDFASGLRILLENDTWKKKGERGFLYVEEVHELNKVIDQHISIYEKLTSH